MATFPKLSDLEFICTLISNSFNVPIAFYDNKNECVYSNFSRPFVNPLSPHIKERLNQYFQYENTSNFPVFFTTTFLETFFYIPIFKNDKRKGNIVVGPTISSEISIDEIEGLLKNFNINTDKEPIVSYYQSLPVQEHIQLAHLSIHLYYLIYRKKITINEIEKYSNLIDQIPTDIKKADVSVAKRRPNITLHTNPIYERKIYQFIKEGRTKEVLHNIKLMEEEGGFGVLSKSNHLRSQKNLAIAGLTLATRSAMEGGLHPETAYTISDLYIQNIEGLFDSNKVISLVERALLDFTERVRKNNKQNYSKPITICYNYIFNNIYEDITLNKLAEVVQLHPNYLSSLFKKETGITLSEYILQTKVEEAKTLLQFTNYSISNIYTLLHFYDQTHFTKVFKRFTGLTPKQFKNSSYSFVTHSG